MVRSCLLYTSLSDEDLAQFELDAEETERLGHIGTHMDCYMAVSYTHLVEKEREKLRRLAELIKFQLNPDKFPKVKFNDDCLLYTSRCV